MGRLGITQDVKSMSVTLKGIARVQTPDEPNESCGDENLPLAPPLWPGGPRLTRANRLS